MTLLARRLWNFAITGVAAAALAWGVVLYDLSLRDASFLTGWLLAGGVAFLAVYNARKKLPFLPLLKSSYWLQAHVYVGVLVIFVFLMHTSFGVPNGPLEVLLWLLFALAAGIGVVGIGLSRLLARRLQQQGERIIFERIAIFRAELAGEVDDLARESVTRTASSALSTYYSTRLHDYFAGPRHFLAHLRRSDKPLQSILREIRSLERYLDSEGKEALEQIEANVVAKNNLDYQYALQLVLKAWLFVHIPLSYGLLVVAVVHVVLVYAFTGATL